MPKGIYVCTRTLDEPLPTEVSQKRSCESCGNDVWVNPDKMAKTAERGDLLVICTSCYGEGKHDQMMADAAAAEDAAEPDETTDDVE